MLGKIKSAVAFALLVGASFAVHAAGLGKLTVNSALGQVLAAEIDLVSLQPGELESLSARVASPESYRDARIEYSSVLRLLRFSVEKRANGQPYLKVTSVAPINEPFVDVLIEVTWPAGRLQREYPILLDPPGFADARARAPVSAAPAAAPLSAAPAPAPAAAATPVPSPSGTPSARSELAAAAPGLVKEAGGDTYGPVEKGENLNKIAAQVKPADVSMEQMLAALYRENKAAFIDNNMNRLKAGQILRVPSAEEVGKISGKEANQEVRTHVANWRAYREGLAGGVASMPARPESTRIAAGQVGAAAVSPPAPPPAETKDVLKLSKTDGAKGAAAGAGAATQERLNAMQEELTAKDKALKEAQSRVSDLEKQIRDMQRLVDLKGGAPVKPGEPAKAADAKVAAAPVEPPKPAEPAKPAPEAPKSADAGKPADATKPAEAPKPAEPPKVAEAPKPAPPKPAKKAAPPPPPEPSFVDQVMDNLPIVLGGLGGVGVLGLGAFMFMRRRRQKEEAGPSSAMTSAFPSDLKPSTVTGKAGGGLVDTGNSSFLTDFDKTGPGTIDTDEVDPVAEAEVYIAYGRDAQAEEILKEAMARDKGRHEIPLKLLEIYHARKSATAFETIAKELRGAVGESSATWAKAAAMGIQIDPTNPLYGGAAGAAAPAPVFEASAPAPKPDLDFDLDSAPAAAAPAAAPASTSFDLDLGTSKTPQPDLPVSNEVPALDFDLAPPATPAAVDVPLSGEAPKDEKPAFDFDLSGLDFPSGGGAAAAPAPDLNLGGDVSAQTQTASLSLTDLDLGDAGGGGGDAVATKLELAKAYLEIGDKDGAREILQEVAKEGSAAQKSEAQSLIASL